MHDNASQAIDLGLACVSQPRSLSLLQRVARIVQLVTGEQENIFVRPRALKFDSRGFEFWINGVHRRACGHRRNDEAGADSPDRQKPDARHRHAKHVALGTAAGSFSPAATRAPVAINVARKKAASRKARLVLSRMSALP